ncbi:hypothetical protein [Galactobacter valiniphilus]|uniref:hypothetical protein n=1 Tax=Galactobacter valiniphilus TaxID=2676122 RepID=UPI00373652EE
MFQPTALRVPAALLDAALSPGLSRRWERGEFVRLTSGYYVSIDEWLGASPWDRFALAVSAKALRAPRSVFCCETAMFIMGLPAGRVPPQVQTLATVPHASGVRPRTFRCVDPDVPPAATTVGHLHLPTPETVRAGDFRVVAAAHAAARVLGRTTLEIALPLADALLRSGTIGISDGTLLTAIEAMPEGTSRRQGKGVLKLADGRSESPGESASRAVMLRLGVEPPELQVELVLPSGRLVRPDYWWRKAGVAGEFDGRGKYLDPDLVAEGSAWEVLRQEKQRQAELLQVANAVVRWTSEDLQRPEVLRERLARAGVDVDPLRRSRLR